MSKWELKTPANSDGRICTRCWIFKLRDEFNRNRVGHNGRCSRCRDCMNKQHHEYRESTDRKKDREYKYKRRHLEIWDQIYFHSEIWEVKEKRYNWYIVKSIMNWTERRISTSDNAQAWYTNCVKFIKLKNPIVLMVSKEKPKFSVESDWELYELI